MDVQYYTIKEVAELFRLNHMTVRRMIKSGVLPIVRMSERKILIPRQAVETYMQLRSELKGVR